MVIHGENGISLVGFRPALDTESADLEKGFPYKGRWRMDYLDTFNSEPNAIEYAISVADGMWGTVVMDDGEILNDKLIHWYEQDVEDDETFYWGIRNANQYDDICNQAEQVRK